MKNTFTKTHLGRFATAKVQANSRRLLVIAIIAVIGFSFAACGNDDNDNGNSGNGNNETDGRLTINGLSAHNGKYVYATELTVGYDHLYACAGLKDDGGGIAAEVTNGSVTLKVWKWNDGTKTYSGFNGSGTYAFDIYCSEGQASGFTWIKVLTSVTFTNGKATASF